MTILIVDDSLDTRQLIKTFLRKGGYDEIEQASNAAEALAALTGEQALASAAVTIDTGSNPGLPPANRINLILLDIVMPEVDGIETLKRIKARPELADIPVIMVTAQDNDKLFEEAFAAGAVDYIRKPINRVDLLARAGSALRLKREMDRRMEVTRQLEVANSRLRELSLRDGLTGVANRRRFDEHLESEWRRGVRSQKAMSLILMDIDYFKFYNDTYGHQAGDECLKIVAEVVARNIHRPADLAARYGGEEFAVILPETEIEDALEIAESIRSAIEALGLPHKGSKITDHVTMSLGVASIHPETNTLSGKLVESADKALYAAKEAGRNNVQKLKTGAN